VANVNLARILATQAQAAATRGDKPTATKTADAAAAHYEAALRQRPDDALAEMNYGMLLAARGRHAQAVPHFRIAEPLLAKDSAIHNIYGISAHKAGLLDEAETQFRKAIALRPDYAEAEANLGFVLAVRGDFAGATEHYQRALAINPNVRGGRAALDALHTRATSLPASAPATTQSPASTPTSGR
jgi:Tfp pilus assembly protein PilF